MGFSVSDLDAYVKTNAKEIATKAITSAQTAQLLLSNGAAQVGVKGTVSVTTMSNAATFIDGASCNRTVADVTTFSDRQITVKPLRNNADFCFKDLYNKVLVELISKGQSEESMDSSVYAKIAEDRGKVIAYEIEKLLWKGDTTLTGTNNLKWINGLLKIVGTDGTEITPTGSDIIAILQSVASQVDVTIREQEDFRVFMGSDTYNTLRLAVFNGKYFVPGNEMEIPGTGVKIEVVSGLNGTNKVVASRISNFQLGLDGTDDSEKAVMKYDEINDKALMDFHFAIGVQVIFPTQAYWASTEVEDEE
jgi:hypothetical protein